MPEYWYPVSILPVTLVFLTTTLFAWITRVPRMSRPLMTVPGVVTVSDPEAFSTVPAGTPVVLGLGQPFVAVDVVVGAAAVVVVVVVAEVVVVEVVVVEVVGAGAL